MNRKWKLIARTTVFSRANGDVKISQFESVDGKRKFTATIAGWKNYKLWEGRLEDSQIALERGIQRAIIFFYQITSNEKIMNGNYDKILDTDLEEIHAY
jgi:hypothetical protein